MIPIAWINVAIGGKKPTVFGPPTRYAGTPALYNIRNPGLISPKIVANWLLRTLYAPNSVWPVGAPVDTSEAAVWASAAALLLSGGVFSPRCAATPVVLSSELNNVSDRKNNAIVVTGRAIPYACPAYAKRLITAHVSKHSHEDCDGHTCAGRSGPQEADKPQYPTDERDNHGSNPCIEHAKGSCKQD